MQNRMRARSRLQNAIVIRLTADTKSYRCVTIDSKLEIGSEDLFGGLELQKQRCLRPYAPWRVRFLEGTYEYYSLEENVASGPGVCIRCEVARDDGPFVFCFI